MRIDITRNYFLTISLRMANIRLCAAVAVMLAGCGAREEKQFAIHHGPQIGIDFRNSITTNDTMNALTFEYIYNGSGVGIGDFNNDGLEDVFFGGNQVSSRLYINKGNLQFTDVTEAAGVTTDKWITGVSIIDINQDGLDDIYLCVAGKAAPEERKNLLFVNEGITNGVPLFREQARQYGIDDDSYSTMAAFFDYDKDGDQDLYLVNNWLEVYNRNNLRPKRVNGEAPGTDNLYRNNGNGTFTDVTRPAGILIEGYGLGIVINDINQDSWPDVYVSNDFMSNDLLWINQGDGTFRNEIGSCLKHQTHNGMGIDIADFNNDMLTDIFVVDMLPPGHKRQKLMTPGQNYDHFHMSMAEGYEPQYMRNTLQLNRGKNISGNYIFSEVAFLSGIAQTDWSWAPLFFDADNDGLKDLFIANGYRKDVTDLDFIFFGLGGDNPFGTAESRKTKFGRELEKLPDVKLNNYMFRNTGTLAFEDVTAKWGLDIPTFTNGTAYSDFDNDGDIDLITNNIDQDVILFENTHSGNHSITLDSKSAAQNEKITIYNSGTTQYFERTPYRGFQSTVTDRIHAGLAGATKADSIVIVWPDGTTAVYKDVPADTIVLFSKSDAKKRITPLISPTAPFTSGSAGYTHREQSPSDIKVVRTLLHEVSRFGPRTAIGDVNHDGLDDFFAGGEKGIASMLGVQQSDGRFHVRPLTTDSLREDGGAAFFDADNDGDADLYIASACASITEFARPHKLLLNDGKGNYKETTGRIPEIRTGASCVMAADYDRDGDDDLFIGGRIETGKYGSSPRSHLLQNNNGTFTDVTRQVSPALLNPGMVTSAVWIDYNQDAYPDLAIAGEWMPVRIFLNKGSSFTEVTEQLGLGKSHGWWSHLSSADIDNDGYPDLIGGNTGHNSFFRPTIEHPVQLYLRDFDKNGAADPLVTYYNPVERNEFMVHNRLVVIDQIPPIKRRFETFTQFATTPFREVFTTEELQDATVLPVYTLSSALFMNQQGKCFETQQLPEVAQISTVNGVVVEDINHDGINDLILAGNFYPQETLFGRYDAGTGTVLLGTKDRQWRELPPAQSGFIIDNDCRGIHHLRTANGTGILTFSNNAPATLFTLHIKSPALP